jgi:hypothetical protein
VPMESSGRFDIMAGELRRQQCEWIERGGAEKTRRMIFNHAQKRSGQRQAWWRMT